MPAAAFKELMSTLKERAPPAWSPSSSAPAPTSLPAEPVFVRDSIERVGKPLDRLAKMSASASSTPMRASMITYVNSVSVFVGLNPDNDRVALVLSGRFMPKGTDEFNGRSVERSSASDAVSAGAAPDDASARLGLGAAVGGIVCAVPRAPETVTKPISGKIALMQSCLPSVSDVPAWISLRASFLDVRLPAEREPAPGDFKLPSSTSAFRSFNLDDVDDDLVRSIGEIAAKLRTSVCLAEVSLIPKVTVLVFAASQAGCSTVPCNKCD